jgi:hypothetical protein
MRVIFEAGPTLFRTRMSQWIECGPGWYNLILGLVKELEARQSGRKEPLLVAQVKEKFGGLRFYVYHAQPEEEALISAAEEASFDVCEECGEKARVRGVGWVATLCDSCNATFKERFVK